LTATIFERFGERKRIKNAAVSDHGGVFSLGYIRLWPVGSRPSFVLVFYRQRLNN
jgi:hypothetical protein